MSVVIPGSKFASDTNNFTRALAFTRRSFISNPKDGDQAQQDSQSKRLDWLWDILEERVRCLGSASYAVKHYSDVIGGHSKVAPSDFAHEVWLGDDGILHHWRDLHDY